MDRNIITKNITAYSVLVLALSLQLVIILAVASSFIPIHLNSFVMTLQPLYWDQVRPHRQLQIYAAFIIFAILTQAGGMFFLKKKLQEKSFGQDLWPFVLMQGVWLFIELTAAFKIFIFGSPAWAKWFLYLSLGAWVLSTIFWPEFRKILLQAYAWLKLPPNAILARRCFNAALLAIVLVLLWPANMHQLLAHIFAWDNFDNLDGFLMHPGWAYLNGMTIHVDVNCNYSAVMPAFLSSLAKICGGFNYENAMRLIIVLTLAYYVAVWAFIRQWTKSSLIAAFGFLLAVKLQMFHWGILPVLWRYPSATPVRYLFDLVPIFFIYKHSLEHRERYLWLAAVGAGLMMAYSMEIGIYLLLGFYAYMFMLLTLPDLRKKIFKFPADIRKLIGLALVPFVAALSLLWCVQGHWVWTSQFWANTSEFQRLFLGGFGSLPYWDGLHDKQFFAFCMGFIIPGVYVLTMMIVGSALYLRRIENFQTFVIYVCVYGLGMYHYFVYRSAVTSYYVVCIPFVLVLCFWLQQFLKLLPQEIRRLILSALVALTFGCLVTGYLFTVYPNVLNLAKLDLSQETAFYDREFNFKPDIDLIDRLTHADEKVPLISSYAAKMLMDAKRKPFFYYFPMVWSEPMEKFDFQGTEILTVERMQKTLAQLDSEKPEYVFIEQKLYGGLPKAYYQHFEALTVLLQHLAAHYQPYAQGQYLLALKFKS